MKHHGKPVGFILLGKPVCMSLLLKRQNKSSDMPGNREKLRDTVHAAVRQKLV